MKKKGKLLKSICVSLALCTIFSVAPFNRVEATTKTELKNTYANYVETEGEEIGFSVNLETGKTTTYSLKENNNFNEMCMQKVASAKSAKSLVNYVYGTITPKKTSYVIRLYNVGLDKIDRIKISCEVYKDSGGFYASMTKTFTNVKVGVTKYTWNLLKADTVQEKIILSGSAKDGKDSCSFSASTYRYNFAGGKYGTMKAYDGQRHHMPSNSVSPLSAYSGPCVRMITNEHKKTASYGNSTEAKNFRKKEKEKINQGKFLAAQKLGIKDVQSKFGIKYNTAINEMVSYTISLGYEE